jgi:2'-5' RNA ligase
MKNVEEFFNLKILNSDMFAVWFTFHENDTQYLSEKIQELSKKYDSQSFIPHITAYGLVDISLDELDQIVQDAIKDEKNFTVDKTQISFSDDFWKTVFVEFENGDSLKRINKKLTDYLESVSKYHFKPHASLIYKKMDSEEKAKLAGDIIIKDNFTVSGMCVQEFSEDISKWKIVRKYQFE